MDELVALSSDIAARAPTQHDAGVAPDEHLPPSAPSPGGPLHAFDPLARHAATPADAAPASSRDLPNTCESAAAPDLLLAHQPDSLLAPLPEILPMMHSDTSAPGDTPPAPGEVSSELLDLL